MSIVNLLSIIVFYWHNFIHVAAQTDTIQSLAVTEFFKLPTYTSIKSQKIIQLPHTTKSINTLILKILVKPINEAKFYHAGKLNCQMSDQKYAIILAKNGLPMPEIERQIYRNISDFQMFNNAKYEQFQTTKKSDGENSEHFSFSSVFNQPLLLFSEELVFSEDVLRISFQNLKTNSDDTLYLGIYRLTPTYPSHNKFHFFQYECEYEMAVNLEYDIDGVDSDFVALTPNSADTTNSHMLTPELYRTKISYRFSYVQDLLETTADADHLAYFEVPKSSLGSNMYLTNYGRLTYQVCYLGLDTSSVGQVFDLTANPEQIHYCLTFSDFHIQYFLPKYGFYYLQIDRNLAFSSLDYNQTANFQIDLINSCGVSNLEDFSACSNLGECNHYQFSFIDKIFSASCDCKNFRNGITCLGENDNFSLSLSIQRLQISLLTLSNLAFLFPIYLAFKFKLWIELAIYAYTMIASIIYHTCDQKDTSIYFCFLDDYDTLQFMDYFNSNVSVWVTLLLLVNFQKGHQVKPTNHNKHFYQLSLLPIICLTTRHDDQSIWNYLIPILVFFGLLGHYNFDIYRKTYRYLSAMYRFKTCPQVTIQCEFKSRFKSMLDFKNYSKITKLWICLVFSLLLAIFFAVILTDDLIYYITHSVWHVCIAISCGLVLLIHQELRAKWQRVNPDILNDFEPSTVSTHCNFQEV